MIEEQEYYGPLTSQQLLGIIIIIIVIHQTLSTHSFANQTQIHPIFKNL